MSLLRAATRERRSNPFYREGIIPGPGSMSWLNSVSDDQAIRIIAMYACNALLADTVATLPVGAYDRQGAYRVKLPDPGWLKYPMPLDPSVTRIDHFSELMWSYGLDGNSFTLAAPSVHDPAELRVLNPTKVEVKTSRGAPVYRVQNGSTWEEFGPDEIIHIAPQRKAGSGRGLSPIAVASDSLATKRAAELLAAKVFGNGMFLSGQLLLPGPASTDSIAQLRAEITEEYVGSANSFKPGIFANGAKWDVPSIDLAQFQLLDTNKNIVIETARLYRIPPNMVGVTDPGAMAYASVEAQGIGYEKFTVRPYVERIEAAYDRLLPGESTFLKFNTNGLLRGDFKSRMEGYAAATEHRIMLPEEARNLEDLPPLDAEAVYLSTPNNSAPDPRYANLTRLVLAGYDPAESLAALGLPPIKHTGLPPVSVQPEVHP